MTVSADLNDRIGKCQKILASDPNSQIFAALAEALRKSGELETAFRTCQTGLRTHPDYGAAHSIMAKISLDRGQFDWAELELKRARELDGSSRATDVLMAEILIYKGEFEKAIKLLKTLLQADPSSVHIKKLLDIADSIAIEQQAEIAHETTIDSEPVVEHAAVVVPGDNGNNNSGAKDDNLGVSSVTAAEIVKSASSIKGLTGSLFVNNEGLLVESKWIDKIDPEICAAAMNEVISQLNQDLVRGSFGEVSWILIETDNQTVQLVRRTNGTFVFLGSKKMNLGPVRMKLTELFDRYEG